MLQLSETSGFLLSVISSSFMDAHLNFTLQIIWWNRVHSCVKSYDECALELKSLPTYRPLSMV